MASDLSVIIKSILQLDMSDLEKKRKQVEDMLAQKGIDLKLNIDNLNEISNSIQEIANEYKKLNNVEKSLNKDVIEQRKREERDFLLLREAEEKKAQQQIAQFEKERLAERRSEERDFLLARQAEEMDATRKIAEIQRQTLQSEADTQSIDKFINTYQEKIRMLQENNLTLFSINPELETQLNSFTQRLSNLREVSDIQGLTQDFVALQNNIKLANQDFNLDLSIDKARQSMELFLTKFSAVKGNPQLMRELDTLKTRLEEIQRTGDSAGFRQWQVDLRGWTTEVEKANLRVKSFGDQLRDAAQKYGLWVSTAALVSGALREMRQGLDTVISLDAAMTELQVVTGQSNDQARESMLLYNQLAQELGLTTQAVTEASVEWLNILGHYKPL